MWSGNIFKKVCQNFALQTLILDFLTKKRLQIYIKWSETHKNRETRNAKFLPFAGAGGRRILHVNASYHTKFHQTLSTNVTCVKKRSKV